MQPDALIRQLGSPGANLARLAGQVKREPELVNAIVAALSSETARVKFAAAKALRILSERTPELVYPHFDLFVGMLRSGNSILRWNAMLVIGNLARVHGERQIEEMIDAYLAPISGPHLIDAANTIRGATAIATAKPHLADRIAGGVLGVERATYATPECRNVAIGHAIECLGRLLPLTTNKNAIRQFVSRQMENSRPATRKKAERFLGRRAATA